MECLSLPPRETARAVPWVKLDDHFAQHPKVAAAGPLAMAMQVAGLSYCNRELTDGFIPRSVARTLIDCDPEAGITVTCQWIIDRLMSFEMWEAVEGGYRIHDYHDYQPTKEEALALREKRAEAGRLGGQQRAAHIKEANEANPKQSAKQNSSKTLANAKQNSNPVSRYPYPVTSDPESPVPSLSADAPAKQRRASPVPENWEPDESTYAWARQAGFSDDEVRREVPRFRNHHRSKGNTFKDVGLAWRNWMDNSRSFGSRASPVTQPKRHGALDFVNDIGMEGTR